MATHIELFDAIADETFTNIRRRISVAVLKKAQAVIEAPTTHAYSKREWAKRVFFDLAEETERMLLYLVADYSHLTVNQIAAVDDSMTSTAVEATVDLIYTY